METLYIRYTNQYFKPILKEPADFYCFNPLFKSLEVDFSAMKLLSVKTETLLHMCPTYGNNFYV